MAEQIEVRVMIDRQLHREVKSKAALQGKTITQVIRESLEAFAGRSKGGKPPSK